MSLASPDPLTRLPRRSSFLMALGSAASTCAANSEPLSLVLVVVAPENHSSTGPEHAAPLPAQTVAKVIRLVAMRDGTVGYLAHGVFGIMMKRAGLDVAVQSARALQTALALYLGKRPVRTSIGVATSPIIEPWSPADLLALADWRLSEARRAGRRGLNFCSYDLRRHHFASWPWL